jgi:murein L,D-transpeptidase YafK
MRKGALMLSLSKHIHTRSVLALWLALTASNAQAEEPLRLPQIDYIRVTKSARVMTLYSGGEAVKVIRGIQLGDAPVGPKHFQGDERTPEGRYTIDYGNPGSAYHLSLHISYPSAHDIAYARSQSRSPGGLIFIHGQPNDWVAGRVPGDWTDGCISVSNAEIEALYEAVPDGTVIDIEG